MKIIIIGSGISGLGAAWALSRPRRDGQTCQITLLEADARIGGHANTVNTPDGTPIDTGFIVFNQKTYPNLLALFDQLDVPVADSDMSFGVSMRGGELEYACDGLSTIFGQWRNLARPGHWRMVSDMLRFFRQGHDLAEQPPAVSLEQWARDNGYSDDYIRDHLAPMGAAIWSASLTDILDFPAASYARFFRNHGLLQVSDQPPWFTVRGGSREYVQRLVADMPDVTIRTSSPVSTVLPRHGGGASVTLSDGQSLQADAVILACHSNQTAAMLIQADQDQQAVLADLTYAPNTAYLHRDKRLMPKRRKLWSSWNVLSGPKTDAGTGNAPVTVSYWMNRLQPLDTDQDWFVTLNPRTEPDPDLVAGRFNYAHPQFDRATIAAQSRLPEIQGRNDIWFAGAWMGWGFHEDGLASGLSVAQQLGAALPFDLGLASPAATNARRATPAPAALPIAAE
ncbi:MAG: NAD/FAD-binding protein [Alphaproteobacteria bacterium]